MQLLSNQMEADGDQLFDDLEGQLKTAKIQQSEDSLTSCRMYENVYPNVDELVMVVVNQVSEMGAYVSLLEYNNIEGMVLLSELSKRRIRSVQKLVRVGRNEVVVVLRVDREKGYIDLSKKRVSPEDVEKCEERFNKSKTVHSILRNVAERKGISIHHLYTCFAWPLYRKYGHAFDAFKEALKTPEQVFEGISLSEDIQRDLLLNIVRRMTPQKVKIRADVEVFCFEYEGIDAIKEALRQAEAVSTSQVPVKVKLVAPPLYVIISQTTEKMAAIEAIELAISRIQQVLAQKGGVVTVKMKPKVVSDADDQELDALMKKKALENVEVSGDENSSDADDA